MLRRYHSKKHSTVIRQLQRWTPFAAFWGLEVQICLQCCPHGLQTACRRLQSLTGIADCTMSTPRSILAAWRWKHVQHWLMGMNYLQICICTRPSHACYTAQSCYAVQEHDVLGFTLSGNDQLTIKITILSRGTGYEPPTGGAPDSMRSRGATTSSKPRAAATPASICHMQPPFSLLPMRYSHPSIACALR